MADDPKNIGGILDRLDELAGKGDRVSLGEVVEALGNRGDGPFLLVPALIEMSPVGGILGVPTVLPFASSAPMLAIAAFGLALLVRDGLLMIAAALLTAAAVAIGLGVMAGGSRGG